MVLDHCDLVEYASVLIRDTHVGQRTASFIYEKLKLELCGGLAILNLSAPLKGRRMNPLTPKGSP
jgi:hypothetical protein